MEKEGIIFDRTIDILHDEEQILREMLKPREGDPPLSPDRQEVIENAVQSHMTPLYAAAMNLTRKK